jgi:iron complex transport system ATP-binding protein
VIEGVDVQVGAEAVVVRSPRPLRAVSSAVVGGGFEDPRAVINLHVPEHHDCADPAGLLDAFAARRAIPRPYIGLLTSAWTEHAVMADEIAHDIRALAVVTVGLSNRVAAGREPVRRCTVGTINTIVVVDADPEPAALVNAVMTATEVKVLALSEAGIRGPDGRCVSGTSTDAVVIAATGRGVRARFGGPASALGWTVGQVVRAALDRGIRAWQERHP